MKSVAAILASWAVAYGLFRVGRHLARIVDDAQEVW